MIALGPVEYFKLALFWGSWLYGPAALAMIFIMARKRGRLRAGAALTLAPLTVLAYARFVEPRILLTRAHDVTLTRCFPAAGAARIAVFSDPHQGLFPNAMPISRIARRIAATRPDFVMIPGDFTYFLAPDRLPETFAALGEIGAPIYAVMGNHDIGLPGPDVSAPLTKALGEIGVMTLNDSMAQQGTGAATIEIAGLSDLWADDQDYTLLEKRGERPRLALTHNPDTILKILPRQKVDLMIAGHTHGGQINIPFVTCALMPGICRVARYGLAETERGPVFVTSGTGMVGLPMRFNAAPVIDVLTVTWRACESNG